LRVQDFLRPYIAETFGTYLLVFFGTGAVASSLFTGAQVGLWQVAVVWGFGITLAIYATASISGAHLNPAVSLAFAIFRRNEFPVSRLAGYWVSQLVGAFLAGWTVLWAFGPFIRKFEQANPSFVRGGSGSELSASAFGEYYPNPSIFGTGVEAQGLISPFGAMLIEAFGTAVLVLMIFSLADRRNAALSTKDFAPFFIGFTVAVLISIFAPLTQAGWNPARDFGPRLVAFFAGWDDIAIPGPRGGFWVYIIGPLIGGPVGAALYEFLLRPVRLAARTRRLYSAPGENKDRKG
jgi:glycerol uptake facilitator protein